MNIDHLRIFLTLAETQSLNKAAKELFLAPPAVKYAPDALKWNSERGFLNALTQA